MFVTHATKVPEASPEKVPVSVRAPPHALVGPISCPEICPLAFRQEPCAAAICEKVINVIDNSTAIFQIAFISILTPAKIRFQVPAGSSMYRLQGSRVIWCL